MVLPYQTLRMQSILSETQALERLQGAVEPGPWLRNEYSERLFAGIVEGHTFELQRIIRYRNYYLPVLYGRIEPGLAGRARIVIAFRPDPLVAAVTIIGLGLFLVAGAIGLSGPPRPESRQPCRCSQACWRLVSSQY
jgi:hypothetical protein